MTSFVPFLPTLDQLSSMTPQQLFDHSAQCLIAQKQPARSAMGCDYSNKHGHHCALGWLIPEELQSTCAGVGVVSELIRDDALHYADPGTPPEILRKILSANENLFVSLQHAHDDTAGSAGKEWVAMCIRKLKQTALMFSLSAAALDVTE
jgi:hypothetical protein